MKSILYIRRHSKLLILQVIESKIVLISHFKIYLLFEYLLRAAFFQLCLHQNHVLNCYKDQK
jgi:hypothetical protein